MPTLQTKGSQKRKYGVSSASPLQHQHFHAASTRRAFPRALRGFDAINFLPRVGLRHVSLPPVSRRRAFPRALRGFDAINFLPRVGLRHFSLPPVSREGSTHDVIPHSPIGLRRFSLPPVSREGSTHDVIPHSPIGLRRFSLPGFTRVPYPRITITSFHTLFVITFI